MDEFSTPHPGLRFLVYDEESPAWADWRSWPTLTVAMDLGSEGVCAYNAMSYHFDMCCWMYPDPSHAAQRSFDQGLKTVGLWDLWLCLMVTWNLEYGPWGEERRRGW